MANEVKTPIPARIYNAAVGGHVAGADDIIDDKTGMVVSELVGNKPATSEENPFNGMGVVILPMNIQEVEEDDTTVQKNILTQAMMNQANTKYVIKYDYVLGEDITVPANCVLEFEGGSISGNGTGKDTVTCNNTYLLGCPKILLSVDGTIKNKDIYTSWFDNPSRIYNIVLSNHTIYFDKPHTILIPLVLEGENIILDGCYNTVTSDTFTFINMKDVYNCEIKNFNFKGTTAEDSVFVGGLSSYTHKYLSIHNNTIDTCRLGIHIASNGKMDDQSEYCDVYNNVINMNNPSGDIGVYGISITGCKNSKFHDNYISGCMRHAFYHAQGSDNQIYNNTFERNNVGQTNVRGVLFIARTSFNIIVSNNSFINNGGVNVHIYCAGTEESELIFDHLHNIYVCGNSFYSNNTNFINYILIGSPDLQETLLYYEKDITIEDNTFINVACDSICALRILSGVSINIKNNVFEYKDSQSVSFYAHCHLLYIGWIQEQGSITDDVRITNNIIRGTNYYNDNEIFWVPSQTETVKSFYITGNVFVNTSARKIVDSFNFTSYPYMTDLFPTKGATASRPILSVQNSGFMYLDTTLDADGKPIWWNGTAWVDALGNSVSTIYPKVIGTPTSGNLAKFNNKDIEDAGIAPTSQS